MSILEQIEGDFHQSLKESNKDVVSTLRMILAALKNERIKKMDDLSDEDVIRILKSEIKKRKESVVEYEKGGRQDLASKEQAEIEIAAKYMPPQLSEEEISNEVKAILNKLDNKDNIGKVMGMVMSELKGKADGSLVKKIVEQELNG